MDYPTLFTESNMMCVMSPRNGEDKYVMLFKDSGSCIGRCYMDTDDPSVARFTVTSVERMELLYAPNSDAIEIFANTCRAHTRETGQPPTYDDVLLTEGRMGVTPYPDFYHLAVGLVLGDGGAIRSMCRFNEDNDYRVATRGLLTLARGWLRDLIRRGTPK